MSNGIRNEFFFIQQNYDHIHGKPKQIAVFLFKHNLEMLEYNTKGGVAL